MSGHTNTMRKSIVIFSAAVVLSAAMLGSSLARGEAPAAEKKEDIRITKNTSVEAKICYRMCSHSVNDKRSFAGMTREGFGKAFGGRVKEFSAEKVRAEKVIDSYCPKHVILKADTDGQIKLMRPDKDGVLQTEMITGVFLNSIEERSRERLKHGIVLTKQETAEGVLISLMK